LLSSRRMTGLSARGSRNWWQRSGRCGRHGRTHIGNSDHDDALRMLARRTSRCSSNGLATPVHRRTLTSFRPSAKSSAASGASGRSSAELGVVGRGAADYRQAWPKGPSPSVVMRRGRRLTAKGQLLTPSAPRAGEWAAPRRVHATPPACGQHSPTLTCCEPGCGRCLRTIEVTSHRHRQPAAARSMQVGVDGGATCRTRTPTQPTPGKRPRAAPGGWSSGRR